MRDARTGLHRFPPRLLEPLVLFRRYHICELDLAGVADAPPPSGVEVRGFRDSDLPALAAAAGPRTVSWLRRWIPLGLRGVVALRGDRLVGHGWYAAGRVPQAYLYPGPVPPDAVVLAWFWVDPSERGGGIGSALVRRRVAQARDEGFRRAWNAIELGNRAPARIFTRLGGQAWRPLGRLTLLRVAGMRRRWWHPAQGGGAESRGGPTGAGESAGADRREDGPRSQTGQG